MRIKKSHLAILVVGLCVAGRTSAVAEAGRHEPDFMLTISTENKTVKGQKGMDVSVSVEEKNILRHSISAGRPSDPACWYTMSVILDGHPAPTTELYRKIVNPRNYDPDAAQTSGGISATIKPGESLTFEIPLTAYFNLSAPGIYEITFSRGTDRGRPESVQVKSTTISITVL